MQAYYIKKCLLWTLIFLCGLGNFLTPFTQKAKASPSKEFPNFDEPFHPADEVPTPYDIEYIFPDSGKQVHLKWKTAWPGMKGPAKYQEVRGFTVKTGEVKTTKCEATYGPTFTEAAPDQLTIGECENKNLTLLGAVHPDGIKSYIQWNIVDKATDINALPDGTRFAIQTRAFGYDWYFSDIKVVILNKVTDPTGDIFSEENISNYIKNKVFPYEASGKYAPEVVDPSKEVPMPGTDPRWNGKVMFAKRSDVDNFKTFMETAKIADGGYVQDVVKNLENKELDPFRMAGYVDEKDGLYHSLLSDDQLSKLRLDFYDGFAGSSDEEFWTKDKMIRDMTMDFADATLKTSCTDLIEDLRSQAFWKPLYGTIGAIIVGGSTALVTGNPYAIAGGSYIGYQTGDSIQEMINADTLPAIEQDFNKVLQASWSMFYAVLFLEYKDLYIGLREFKNKGDGPTGLPQWQGINPYKFYYYNKMIDIINKQWDFCQEEINKYFGQVFPENQDCGITGRGAVDMLGIVICDLINFMANIAEGLVKALFTTVFDARAPGKIRLAFRDYQSSINISNFSSYLAENKYPNLKIET